MPSYVQVSLTLPKSTTQTHLCWAPPICHIYLQLTHTNGINFGHIRSIFIPHVTRASHNFHVQKTIVYLTAKTQEKGIVIFMVVQNGARKQKRIKVTKVNNKKKKKCVTHVAVQPS